MKLTDIFVTRPVLAICINLIVLVVGFTAVDKIPTRQYPRSDLSVINVKTVFVGASSDLVKGYVTTPLERVIASADGIDYIESTSEQGLSTIKAHLALNFDVGKALTQVQAKVAQVRNDLPQGSELPIIEVESTDNRFAAIYIGFSSTVLSGNQITDYLIRVVQPQLSSVLGVQRADVLGDRTFAMRIWLNSDKLNALGVSGEQVRSALTRNNYLSAIGSSKGALMVTPLTANTDLQNAEEFKRIIIKAEGQDFVRLGDVADVELGAENYDADVRFNGQQAVFMGVWVLPDANSLEVVRKIRKLIPEIRRNLPQGITVEIPYDSTQYIDDAITEVIKTLTETVIIVIAVIYLFIGSMRSVIVPVVAIPLSLVGAVGIMWMLGFTLNLLTLLAIVLAVGLVVDDAIVMLENVERKMRKGTEPIKAAIEGARELFGPVVAMTITLAAVYAPIGIQGGLTGALFKEFAFTLSGAVIVSGFVALTLSPMMASRLVSTGKPSRFQLKSESVVHSIEKWYTKVLNRVIGLRFAILAGSIILLLITAPLYMFSQQELAPREDQGVVFGIVQASPNASIEQTSYYTAQTQAAFKSLPEYKTSFQITSPAGGFSGALVKPWSERKRTTQEMEADLWVATAGITGIRMIITTPPPLPGGSDFPVEMIINSTDDPSKMLELSQQLVGAAFASGKFMFADTDLKYDLPQGQLIFDRDKVAAAGLQLADIGEELGSFMGGNYVNRFSISGRSYKVVPQLERRFRLTPDQLEDIKITAKDGSKIPIGSLANLQSTVIPRQLNKFQQLNSFKVYGVPVPGTTIDQALAVLEEKAAEIMPHGYAIDYPGESRQLRKEQNSFTKTLLLSIIFIYLVLASQFESFRDPFIILFGSVPLCLAGALIFPFLGFTSINIYSQVGLVTLVGLVSKNGILIVEFANVLKEQGLSKMEAVTKAAVSRLRPILMTSVATVVGHFPLVIATGAGAGSRNSIGIVLVSGMIIGTFFTLFVVPVLYLFISKEHNQSAVSMKVVKAGAR